MDQPWRLRRRRPGRRAMRAGCQSGLDDAVRVRLQRPGHTGATLARRLAALRPIGLLALRRRQRGILRRLRRRLQRRQPRCQFGNPRLCRCQLANQRQQRADQRTLLGDRQRAEVELGRHPDRASNRP
jgi:hypothetical protein